MSTLTDEQLEKLVAEVESLPSNDIRQYMDRLAVTLENKEKGEIRTLYKEFTERVAKLGFARLEDFILAAENTTTTRKSSTPRRPVAVRFRDTENASNTWTGRGKHPRWLAAKLEQGHSLDEFAVPESESENGGDES